MKIIYAATPEISISCLEKLLDSSHELSLVLTMPDKPSGRGKKLMPGPIKKFCIENSLPFMQPENLNDLELENKFNEINPDLLIVFAYGKIIPKKIFESVSYTHLTLPTKRIV